MHLIALLVWQYLFYYMQAQLCTYKKFLELPDFVTVT